VGKVFQKAQVCIDVVEKEVKPGLQAPRRHQRTLAILPLLQILRGLGTAEWEKFRGILALLYHTKFPTAHPSVRETRKNRRYKRGLHVVEGPFSIENKTEEA